MAMTLKLLRSRCLTEVQDHNPGTLMPSIDVEVRKAIVRLVRSIGGIRSSSNITSEIGKRDYGLDESFPSDAIGIYGVFNTSKSGMRIWPSMRKDRIETDTTGDFSYYYIYNRRSIGFDVLPAEAGQTIRIDYLGLGTAPSLDTAEILTSLPQLDDDNLWDSIVFEYAHVYFRRKAIHNVKFYENARYYEVQANQARYAVMSALGGNLNQDEALEIVLDEDFFGRTGINTLERFANEGDLLTIF